MFLNSRAAIPNIGFLFFYGHVKAKFHSLLIDDAVSQFAHCAARERERVRVAMWQAQWKTVYPQISMPGNSLSQGV